MKYIIIKWLEGDHTQSAWEMSDGNLHKLKTKKVYRWVDWVNTMEVSRGGNPLEPTWVPTEGWNAIFVKEITKEQFETLYSLYP